MARQALYDPSKTRTRRDTVEEMEMKHGTANGAATGYKPVEIFWDINQEAKNDGVCRIKIGSEETCVNAEQLMKFLRWV